MSQVHDPGFVLIWGLAGSIREVTQSPLQSFPVKLERELGGAWAYCYCLFISPHLRGNLRQSWILDSTPYIPDASQLHCGIWIWIAIVSGILDSWSCKMFLYSGFYKQRFPGFPYIPHIGSVFSELTLRGIVNRFSYQELARVRSRHYISVEKA